MNLTHDSIFRIMNQRVIGSLLTAVHWFTILTLRFVLCLHGPFCLLNYQVNSSSQRLVLSEECRELKFGKTLQEMTQIVSLVAKSERFILGVPTWSDINFFHKL